MRGFHLKSEQKHDYCKFHIWLSFGGDKQKYTENIKLLLFCICNHTFLSTPNKHLVCINVFIPPLFYMVQDPLYLKELLTYTHGNCAIGKEMDTGRKDIRRV